MDEVSSVYSDVTIGIDDIISYPAAAASYRNTKLKTLTRSYNKRTDTDHDDAVSVSSSDLASLSLSDSESLNTPYQVEKMCLQLEIPNFSSNS